MQTQGHTLDDDHLGGACTKSTLKHNDHLGVNCRSHRNTIIEPPTWEAQLSRWQGAFL